MVVSMRYVSICLTLPVILALCTSVWAQREPVNKPGLTVRHTGNPPPFALVCGLICNNPIVQEELDLTEDQKANLKEAVDRMRAVLRELSPSIRRHGSEDLQAKMKEVRKRIEDLAGEMKKTFEDVLSPKQLERLRGIALQVIGVSALTIKEVQRNLALSDDQVAKIEAAGNDLDNSYELFSERADRQSLAVKTQELRATYEKKVMGVLTANQKALLDKMKGTKLEFPGTQRGFPRAVNELVQIKGVRNHFLDARGVLR